MIVETLLVILNSVTYGVLIGALIGNIQRIESRKWKNFKNYFSVIRNFKSMKLVSNNRVGSYIFNIHTNNELIYIYFLNHSSYWKIENHKDDTEIKDLNIRDFGFVRFILLEYYLIAIITNKITKMMVNYSGGIYPELSDDEKQQTISSFKRKYKINQLL